MDGKFWLKLLKSSIPPRRDLTFLAKLLAAGFVSYRLTYYIACEAPISERIVNMNTPHWIGIFWAGAIRPINPPAPNVDPDDIERSGRRLDYDYRLYQIAFYESQETRQLMDIHPAREDSAIVDEAIYKNNTSEQWEVIRHKMAEEAVKRGVYSSLQEAKSRRRILNPDAR